MPAEPAPFLDSLLVHVASADWNCGEFRSTPLNEPSLGVKRPPEKLGSGKSGTPCARMQTANLSSVTWIACCCAGLGVGSRPAHAFTASRSCGEFGSMPLLEPSETAPWLLGPGKFGIPCVRIHVENASTPAAFEPPARMPVDLLAVVVGPRLATLGVFDRPPQPAATTARPTSTNVSAMGPPRPRAVVRRGVLDGSLATGPRCGQRSPEDERWVLHLVHVKAIPGILAEGGTQASAPSLARGFRTSLSVVCEYATLARRFSRRRRAFFVKTATQKTLATNGGYWLSEFLLTTRPEGARSSRCSGRGCRWHGFRW